MSALVCAGIAFASAAAPLTRSPVLDAQIARLEANRAVNRARVAEDLRGAGRETTGVCWYAVPALSDVMRLADTYPSDGALGGELRLVAAKGEFESASFQLFSFEDLEGVQLEVSPLIGPDGSVVPAADVDLRVVKTWLQCGNAWNSYFYDYGKKLVPEFLLHDEDLFRVDLAAQRCYARVGKDYVWIDVPQEFGGETFDPVNDDFHDAPALRPVRLAKDEFKQFVLTVRVPKSATSGVFRGEVKVRGEGERRMIQAISVAVRVLDFELPRPAVFRHTERPYVCSFMGGETLGSLTAKAKGDRRRGAELARRYFKSMLEHNVLHPAMEVSPEEVAIVKELGFPLDFVYCEKVRVAEWLGAISRPSWDVCASQRRRADERKAYFEKLLGHSRVAFRYGDEFPARFIASSREFLDSYAENGMVVGMAGHHGSLQKGVGTYELVPLAGDPDNPETELWSRTDGCAVGFYASQHNGSENPAFVRRQHGLLGYLNGATMTMNFCFSTGPYNDSATREPPYKPFTVAYLNGDGLLETLAFAGFREAIDDLRYATLLQRTVRRTEEKDVSAKARRLGRQAAHYLAFLDSEKADLDAVRAEMIEYVVRINAALED